MGARPIRRTDPDGVVWKLSLEDRGDGVWGYWHEETPVVSRSTKRPPPGTRFVFTAKQAKEFQEHAFSRERHKGERMERKKERAHRGRAIFDAARKEEEAAHKRERPYYSGLDAEAGIPARGYCGVCGKWCFLDGTVLHAAHCSRRYWHLTYEEDDGHARRGKALSDKELLRIFKQAGLQSTYEWQVDAPRRGLPNWSTYQRRFRSDKRRRAGEPIFDFVRRISARIR